MVKKVRVIIADDHPGVRKGLRVLLEKLPGIFVIGEAENGREAIELVERYSPDVLILDIQMPILDGFEVIERLSQSGVHSHILVLSAVDDPLLTKELFSMGACQFVAKGDISALIRAVQQAIAGKCQEAWPGDAPHQHLSRIY